MKRLLVLALLGLLAGRADAQLIKIMSGDTPGSKRHKSGNEPPPFGPWYNYWPLEAHFQVPAMPEYPYWGAPQTMPVVPPAPYNARPAFGPAPANGAGAVPNGGYGGYPANGYAPNGNVAPPATMPPASNQSQAAPGGARYPYQAYGYQGYGYQGQGYGYNPLQQRPAVAPYPGNQPRQ